MANGDEIFRNARTRVVKLLDAVAATGTSTGQWIDCGDYQTGFVLTQGATGAAVTDIEVSNAAVQPSNATAGLALATAAAATDISLAIPVNPRWLKATITILGTGTVTSIVVLRNPG